jgi:hypothetical protein
MILKVRFHLNYIVTMSWVLKLDGLGNEENLLSVFLIVFAFDRAFVLQSEIPFSINPSICQSVETPIKNTGQTPRQGASSGHGRLINC